MTQIEPKKLHIKIRSKRRPSRVDSVLEPPPGKLSNEKTTSIYE